MPDQKDNELNLPPTPMEEFQTFTHDVNQGMKKAIPAPLHYDMFGVSESIKRELEPHRPQFPATGANQGKKMNSTAATVKGFFGGAVGGSLLGGLLGFHKSGGDITGLEFNTFAEDVQALKSPVTKKFALIGGVITAALGTVLSWEMAREHNKRAELYDKTRAYQMSNSTIR